LRPVTARDPMPSPRVEDAGLQLFTCEQLAEAASTIYGGQESDAVAAEVVKQSLGCSVRC
jgi:hypothetical protein